MLDIYEKYEIREEKDRSNEQYIIAYVTMK